MPAARNEAAIVVALEFAAVVDRPVWTVLPRSGEQRPSMKPQRPITMKMLLSIVGSLNKD